MSGHKENLSEYQYAKIRKDFKLLAENTRHVRASDVKSLEPMITTDIKAFFGNADIAEALLSCHLSLCVENPEGEVVGFVCLNDHPNVPSLPPWEWEHWLRKLYHLYLPRARNTLWIKLAGFDKRYKFTFLEPLLRTIYADHNFVEYIILVVPPRSRNMEWFDKLGTRIVPTGNSDPHKVQTLYLMVRQHFVTKYKIRRAVEEDNDDLVPLIHAYSERLQEHYGEYYIAEMLTTHADSGRHMIVAEYQEHAVAVLCLNEIVNTDLLNEAFEVNPFYGLKTPDDDDELGQLECSTIHMDTTGEEQDEGDVPLNIFEAKTRERDASESEGSKDSFLSVELKSPESGSTETDESMDNFSIVGVDSFHMLFNAADRWSEAEGSDKSDACSAMMLSFNDYEMHLYADRTELKTMSYDDLQSYFVRQSKCNYDQKISAFYGNLNAFTLELAAAHPEHEVESLELLIKAAFECYPDREYCVLSIPSTCPPFPLIQQFCRVAPRRISTYPHELYVLHRNVVSSEISVRPASRYDTSEVQHLTANIPFAEPLLASFSIAVNSEEGSNAFILSSGDKIVGVAVLREEEEFEYLKDHYALMDFIDEKYFKPDAHGLLEYVALSPLFQRHARFFLREIQRLSDFGVLYYRILPRDLSAFQRDRPLCCTISDLIPVRPRPIREPIHLDHIRVDPAFGLFLSIAPHSTLRRHEINKKIVVVGTSEVALAFLDSLITNTSSSYHAVFTNVTVVSPQDLFDDKPYNKVRDLMFVKKQNFSASHVYYTALRTYINTVNAVMTGIDRKNKLLILNDNNYLAYDMLFLMCGEQFQKPVTRKVQRNKKSAREFPDNVFLINTEPDATNALIKLKSLVSKHPNPNYKIIVYGHALEAYCCLTSLLEYGVAGANIIFVESFPLLAENKLSHQVSHFNNNEVDDTVRSAIFSEGITVYSAYYYLDWTFNTESRHITSVLFQSRHLKINLDCVAMFMFNDKMVSVRTFMAISHAGLVFDGALVVEPDCRTNDPYIYAAGTITKYSRRYYADHLAHRYFNMEEIGHTLGRTIRAKLVPNYDEAEEPSPIRCKGGDKLVPVYKKPLITFCRFPGQLWYLSVTKPGQVVPLDVAMSNDDYGKVSITGDCMQIGKQGYFRLHLNQNGYVETITCLAEFEFERKNLTSLWGKHERLLNNLQMRFEMAMITDLFEYFREPWTSAIYHDRFSLLEKAIQKLLLSQAQDEDESLIEQLMRMFEENNWNKLSAEEKDELDEKFTGSIYHHKLEELVLDFLRDNDTQLTMYAHPSTVHTMLNQGQATSPLFHNF